MKVNIKNRLKGWNINGAEGIAEDNSGIGFRHIPDGKNGKSRVEILNMPEWFSSKMEQDKSLEECNKKLKELTAQFALIREKIMTPSKKNGQIQSNIR
ncbi:MAG: hypothetical protein LBJ01_03100 [Tannerella sp.]|nr:hypothetical protein [Tannerella sp.]